MIESVRGFLLKKVPTFCVVNCSGIGIGIFISLNTYQNLGEEGSEINLLTYLHVREDALLLYGFYEESEREMFRRLISISGIGPRLTMTILSGLSVMDLRKAITSEDVDVLTRIPGIGKKTAQRVILELKEKISLSAPLTYSAIPGLSPQEKDKVNQALQALVTLGYRQTDAKNVLERTLKKLGNQVSLEDLIKYALQEF
ncbi:MAG: Holliday junction DNA helicase RuvA [Caldithrix sp. RBG_13_44_9]|nr:MAG: Holliday junction DNA helicase RuvA [Caldithrix sp. RBG_13_44_9]